MAKSSTTKKSAAKKSSAKAKSSEEKLKKTTKAASKTTAKKKAAAKPAAKSKKTVKSKTTAEAKPKKTAATKTAKKSTSAAQRAGSPKKVTKKKTAEKKTRKESTMAKKTPEKVETKGQPMSAAEARAKALANIKGYGKKDLDHFKKIITEKRDEIIEQLQNLRDQMLDPTTGEYINENSPYSLHMAEQGTDAMEREKTFLYAQRENKFLGYLEDALKRIEAGTYGICIECIEEPQHLCETCPLIPKARLEAVPHSQLCLPIKQRQEKR